LPWLFAADRADHLEGRVEPALRAGAWVVSDRYVPSSLAYQSLAMDLEDVYTLNASFRVPDLTLFLSVPVRVALARVLQRDAPREIFEVEDRLEAVAERYERVLQRLRERGDPLVVLDGTLPVERVHQQILTALRERWP
jgi:dTMP kinase